MTGDIERLMLNIDAGPEVDAEELAELTQQLRGNLMELDVEAVEFVGTGKAPKGAKAGEPVIWGKLLVTFPPVLISKLIDALQAWLVIRQCSIDLEISGNKLKLTGNPTKEQIEAIKIFTDAVGK